MTLVPGFTHNFVTAPKLLSVTAEDGSRYYAKEDGTRYTSVTTFLSELPSDGLAAWKKRVGSAYAEKIRVYSTTRGKILHGYIEDYLLNKDTRPNGMIVKRLFNQVKPTLDKLNNIRLIEQPLYSDKLMLAGTPDCIAEYEGDLAVVDFKGSEKEKANLDWIRGYFCQTGAYAVMFNELFGQMPKKTVVLIAVEDSNLPQVIVKDTSECVALLKDYAKQLIEHRKELSGKLNQA